MKKILKEERKRTGRRGKKRKRDRDKITRIFQYQFKHFGKKKRKMDIYIYL